MRKTIKNLAFLLVTAFCLTTVTGIFSVKNVVKSDEIKEPLIRYDLPYIDEQTEMPILGYMGVPGSPIGTITPSYLTRANIKAYMDCGFNILSGLYEKVPLHNAEVHKALELCEELELCYFVCDNKYRSSFDEPQQVVPDKDFFINMMQNDFYMDSPAFGGVAVRDEPNIHCFDQMGSVTEALNELTNGKKLVYTNLYPKGANQSQLGYSSQNTESTWEQYEDYVKKYLEKVNPSVLSYDCYTITAPNSTVQSANGLKGTVGYYAKSLSMMRKYANEYNIPFWVTVASHDHVTNKGDSIPIKRTSWVVNSSLAYGAKGIQYYTYWNDGASNTDINTWSDQGDDRSQGLVTINGALTDNYYRIQKINNHIKLVDQVLINAEHKGIMQFGVKYLEVMPEDILYSFGALRNIKGDAFVGCFTHNGNDVYYVVNNSVTTGVKTFKADFSENVNLRLTGLNYVTDKNPNGRVEYSDLNTIGFNLAGGEAVLIEVIK